MNTFTNLLLAIVKLLSKLTGLREFFMLISWNSMPFRFSLNTYITYVTISYAFCQIENKFTPMVKIKDYRKIM